MRLKKSKWKPEEYLDLYNASPHTPREIKTSLGGPVLACEPTDEQMRYLLTNKAIRPHIRAKSVQHWVSIVPIAEINGMLGIKPIIRASDSKTYYQNRFGYFHNVNACNAYRRENQPSLRTPRF